jgi:beta-lactamase class D
LHQAYSEFTQEHEDLDHMNQINKDTSSVEKQYYLPHHTVFKSFSSTTGTCIVFDDTYAISSLPFAKNLLFIADTCEVAQKLLAHTDPYLNKLRMKIA